MTTTLLLRAETKDDVERRSARKHPKPRRRALIDNIVTPSTVKTLLDDGYRVLVERSADRCYQGEEFEKVGATLVATGPWEHAPKEYIIVGLKELAESDGMHLSNKLEVKTMGLTVINTPCRTRTSTSDTATRASRGGKSTSRGSSVATGFSTILNSSLTTLPAVESLRLDTMLATQVLPLP